MLPQSEMGTNSSSAHVLPILPHAKEAIYFHSGGRAYEIFDVSTRTKRVRTITEG